MKKERTVYMITYFVTAAFGTLSHFVYQWLPLPLVSLFFPINESIWEHLKLLFWPLLLAGAFLAGRNRNKQSTWGAVFSALLLAPALLLGIHYTLVAGFAVHARWVDVLLYYLVLAAAFVRIWRLNGSEKAEALARYLIMPVGVYGSCLILFTLAPPSLPIFR